MENEFKPIPKKLMTTLLAGMSNFEQKLTDKDISTSSYVVYGTSMSITSKACFRGLPSEFPIRKKQDGNMYYLLKKVADYISYEKILKELTKYYKGITKINVYQTSKKNVLLIQLVEKEGIPDRLLYAAYYVLFVILRAIDTEFARYWIANKVSHKDEEVDTVEKVIKYFTIHTGGYGHGINDGLYSIQTSRDSKLFETAVRKFVAILEYVCGKAHDWKKVTEKFPHINKMMLDDGYHDYLSQTPCFDLIESIHTFIKKEEKGDNK